MRISGIASAKVASSTRQCLYMNIIMSKSALFLDTCVRGVLRKNFRSGCNLPKIRKVSLLVSRPTLTLLQSSMNKKMMERPCSSHVGVQNNGDEGFKERGVIYDGAEIERGYHCVSVHSLT